jgi:osmotically-inducible protein OsmY
VVPAKGHQQTTPQNGRTQTTGETSSNPAPGADNTANNQPDQAASAPTADQQGNGKSDLQLTASIRRSIVADGSLSTYADNVKIVVQNGVATLKGPVRTQEEKTAIEAKAAAVVGQDHVVDQMEIAPQ